MEKSWQSAEKTKQEHLSATKCENMRKMDNILPETKNKVATPSALSWGATGTLLAGWNVKQ